MRKKSSALLIALFTSAGFVMAAGGSDSGGISDGFGTNPKHVTGAAQKGAGSTGSGGTGMSAPEQGAAHGANKDAAQKRNGSGMAYIDCPGNAFSNGIRTDTKGAKTECVSPDSVVIEGSDNLTRDSTTPGPSEGPGSKDRITTGGSDSAAGNAGNESLIQKPSEGKGEDAKRRTSP